MTIIKTIDFQDFVATFEAYGRKEQFSRAALRALFDYYEELSDDTGEPWELDVIGICCDWAEMTWHEVAESYNVDLDDCEDDDERINAVVEYLQDNTSYIELAPGWYVVMAH